MDGFRDNVEEHVDLADEFALPAYQWYGPLWRAVDATLAGRYDLVPDRSARRDLKRPAAANTQLS
jgi:hypothetical protein